MTERNEIQCPFCGQSQSDPWDLHDGDGEHPCDCQECGKQFVFKVRTETWFSAWKPKKARAK